MSKWAVLLAGSWLLGSPLVQAESVRSLSLVLESAPRSEDGAAARAPGPAAGALRARLVGDVRHEQGLPRQRSKELSEQQLVGVAYDERGREIFRTAVLDPRLLRLETTDAQGRLHNRGRRFVERAQLELALPARTRSLQLLKPRWNGRNHELDELARVELPR